MSYLSLSPPSTPSRQKNKYNSGMSGSSSSKNNAVPFSSIFSPSSSSAKGVSWTNPTGSADNNGVSHNSPRDRGGSMSAPSSPNPKRIKDNSSQPGTPTRGISGSTSQMGGVAVSSSDRYIANRASIDFDYCNSILSKAINDENYFSRSGDGTSAGGGSNPAGSVSKRFNRSNMGLREFYMANGLSDKRLISCFDAPAASPQRLKISSAVSMMDRESVGSASPATSPIATKRSLPTGPSRILDAPDLEDDYYLNLLHWGANNVVAVALKHTVYLWHAETGRIDQLPNLPADSDSIVTSVQWAADGSDVLAVGTSTNTVQLWDCKTSTKLRELDGHSQRVSALSWSRGAGAHSLSSGSRDSSILNYDTRQAHPVVSRYSGHLQEVCGLTWNEEGTTLASGGNENLLCLFDSRWGGAQARRRSEGGDTETHSARLIIEQHHAAVKALSWCPFLRNVLASGGGTADRTLRIWNTTQGTNIKTVDTGSQVCSIQWSDSYKELVTSHGFSDNQLILWKYPTMQKTHEFTGHTKRVLHMAKSPDGSTICSASADETLRFWDLFSPSSTKASNSSNGSSYLSNNMLLR